MATSKINFGHLLEPYILAFHIEICESVTFFLRKCPCTRRFSSCCNSLYRDSRNEEVGQVSLVMMRKLIADSDRKTNLSSVSSKDIGEDETHKEHMFIGSCQGTKVF